MDLEIELDTGAGDDQTQESLVLRHPDGATERVRRYSPHHKDPLRRPSLCIWYSDDPPEPRWVSATACSP